MKTARLIAASLVVPAFLSLGAVAPAFAQSQPPAADPTNPSGATQPMDSEGKPPDVVPRAPAGQMPSPGQQVMNPATSNPTRATTGLKNFVDKAAISNAYEIAAAQVALKRSNNAEVKAFAQAMITDHTRLGRGLARAARRADPTIVIPAGLDAPHAQELKRLRGMKKGAAFDRAYVMGQVLAHQEAVGLFGTYAKENRGTPLATFARKALPILQTHLAHITALSEQMAQ